MLQKSLRLFLPWSGVLGMNNYTAVAYPPHAGPKVACSSAAWCCRGSASALLGQLVPTVGDTSPRRPPIAGAVVSRACRSRRARDFYSRRANAAPFRDMNVQRLASRSARVSSEKSSMPAQSSAAHKSHTPPQRRKPIITASRPLKNTKRELFSQHVASGKKVTEAYKLVGFTGGDRARWEVRNAPEVMARIEWLLEQRDADRQRVSTGRKNSGDLRLRVLKRLERIAFGDIRQVAAWDKRAVTDSEGNVTELRDFVTLVPSRNLTHEAAATVKAVFSKSGELRLELHDPQPALEKLCKALGLYADAHPAPAGDCQPVECRGDGCRRDDEAHCLHDSRRPSSSRQGCADHHREQARGQASAVRKQD